MHKKRVETRGAEGDATRGREARDRQKNRKASARARRDGGGYKGEKNEECYMKGTHPEIQRVRAGGREAAGAAGSSPIGKRARTNYGRRARALLIDARHGLMDGHQAHGQRPVNVTHRAHTNTEAQFVLTTYANIVQWVTESTRPPHLVNDHGFRTLMTAGGIIGTNILFCLRLRWTTSVFIDVHEPHAAFDTCAKPQQLSCLF
ncbi:hypothetical protein FB451DRAFT_1171541 [Mycena latifolia]|nr:hypothetical protein FB451DRAFT_1171541 [Mycena latifolia]